MENRDRELLRLPVGPATPHVPATMTVPRDCRLVEPGALPGTEDWEERYGGPWLLVSQEETEVPTPPEFFLRELLPLESSIDGVVAGWCRRWGVPLLPPMLHEPQLQVVGRRDVSKLLTTMSDVDGSSPPQSGEAVDRKPRDADEDPIRRLPQLVEAAVRTSGAMDTSLYNEQYFYGPRNEPWVGVPLSVARLRVHVLQCLVDWWTRVVPANLTTEWFTDPDPDPMFFFAWQPFGHPSNQFDGFLFGLDLLNSLLGLADPLQVGAVFVPTGKPAGTRSAPVTDIVALELTRYIADQIPAQQCANETCTRLYVRQTGRAKRGQHRTSATKYCSDTCAHAQAQREFRRREATKRRRG